MFTSNIFRIPKAYEESFQDFFDLGNNLRDKLINELSGATIELSNKKNIKKIAENLNISISKLINIDKMIFSLFSLIDDKQLPINEIADGLIEACNLNENIKINEEDCNNLKEHLIKVLSLYNQPYGLSAKAIELSNDYTNLFMDVKILTDIRPIFKNDTIEPPIANLIIHNLKINYHSNNEEKELYITMDSDDIDKALEILNRAKQKELSIKQYLTEKNIKLLEFDKD